MAKKTSSTKSTRNAAKKTAVKNVAAKKTATKPETKIVSPPSITELVEVAATIGKIKVPESMIKQRDKLADAATKLSKRIFNGLDSEDKKAEREVKKATKAAAKTKRDAAKNEKKLARIKKLKDQLAVLEAPATNGK